MSLQVNTAQGPFAVPVSVPTGAQGAVAQFTATPGAAIPDNNPAGVSSNLTVSGVPGLLTDLDVRMNITHTYDGDLAVRLRAPDGDDDHARAEPRRQRRQLHEHGPRRRGRDRDLAPGTAPFTGSFRPEQPLSAFDGRTANGTWTLNVVDSAGGRRRHADARGGCRPAGRLLRGRRAAVADRH